MYLGRCPFETKYHWQPLKMVKIVKAYRTSFHWLRSEKSTRSLFIKYYLFPRFRIYYGNSRNKMTNTFLTTINYVWRTTGNNIDWISNYHHRVRKLHNFFFNFVWKHYSSTQLLYLTKIFLAYKHLTMYNKKYAINKNICFIIMIWVLNICVNKIIISVIVYPTPPTLCPPTLEF